MSSSPPPAPGTSRDEEQSTSNEPGTSKDQESTSNEAGPSKESPSSSSKFALLLRMEERKKKMLSLVQKRNEAKTLNQREVVNEDKRNKEPKNMEQR